MLLQSVRNIRISKAVIIVVFCGVFACVNLIPNMSLYKIPCLHDYTQEYMAPANTWLAENEGAKRALLIMGGLLSDIIFLVTLGLWTIKGCTWRLPVVLCLVYLAKAILSVSESSSPR